jgi:hypothetical protein
VHTDKGLATLPERALAGQSAIDPGADPASRAKRRKITQAIVLAGLLLGMPLFARLGWPAGLELEFEKRSIGFMMGVMVMFASNAIPKQASSARYWFAG